MELRRSFNEDAVNYDTYRPEYPNELFEDIISYSQIGPGSNLIEIGVGTGQATLPFIQLGCNITGIELGDNLSAFVAEKYRGHSNFRVINADFMHYPIEEDFYDLIYCATAFHWLPQEEAYIHLLNTYSDHRALDMNLKEQFETEMRKAINEVGGNINIYDTIDLYLAGKL